jgi:plasmid stabilization system protein ParE
MVVVWLPGAEKRLKGIYTFYRKMAGENTAQKVVDRIKEKAKSLKNVPYRGRVEMFLDDLPGEHRSVVVKHLHKIIYRIEGDYVFILSIFDCRQNPETLRSKVKRDIRKRTNS